MISECVPFRAVPGNMFYKIRLCGSGGEAVWESHVCCFGLAGSPLEPRAAPCAPGAWERAELFLLAHKPSGSTAQAEQIQCAMKTLVLPGSHTAGFPFPALCRILSSVSVDGHVKLQCSGHRPQWCELHVQSCECLEEWNLVPIMRLES